MDGQIVVPAGVKQREYKVLSLICRIPNRDHSVVAISRAPIGYRLRHAFPDRPWNHLKYIGFRLIHTPAGHKQRMGLAFKIENEIYSSVEITQSRTSKQGANVETYRLRRLHNERLELSRTSTCALHPVQTWGHSDRLA